MFISRNRPHLADNPAEDEDELVTLAPAVSRSEVFHNFWPWVREDRYRLVLGTCLLAAGSFGEVVSVWLFKDLIDEVLVPRHLGAFWPLAVTLVTATVLYALLTFLGDYTATRVAERFILRLRTACTAHLHTLPPDTLRTRWHGDVLARMTTDITHIEEFVASGVIEFASAVISLGMFVTAAFFLSWQLSLAVFATAPAFWLSSRYFSDRIQRRSREAMRQDGKVTATIEESLTNAPVAHAYNQQPHEVERVEGEGRKLLRAELATARIAQLFPAFLEVLEVVGGLAVIGLGAFELTRGALTLGGLLAFAAFLTQLFRPASQLSALATSFGAASASAERIIELGEMRSPILQSPHAVDRPLGGRGELRCKDIRAGYPGGSAPVLRDVNFTVAPGEILAVMGPSGAGKSTLAKLLVRFMDPEQGSVLLDGRDLREFTLTSLRDAVTLLPQTSQLFRATVHDNIAYGRPGATPDEVIQAAQDAGAHSFILDLPRGYRTILGQDGLQLSGGQARRIGIARAFLRAAAVLVLDEPTADLDNETALRLVAPLRRLMADRTTVLITHDPALAAHADAVFTLDATGAPEPPTSSGPSSEPPTDPPPGPLSGPLRPPVEWAVKGVNGSDPGPAG